MIDNNRKPPILVCGAHRTGTTWVGKMLAVLPQAAYISEPLNVHHRPGVFSASVPYWYTYITAENEETYLPAYKLLIELNYHLWSEIRSLRSRKDFLRMVRDVSIFWAGKLCQARPLMKDPFAVFSLPWFAQRLGCAVVVTVRQPYAFAASLKRLGWSFDFSNLLSQPLLMRDWLEPYRTDMEMMLSHPQDIISQAALLWRMIYEVVDRQRSLLQAQGINVLVVKHEELSLEPLKGFRDLYRQLGLDYHKGVERRILSSSSSENPSERAAHKAHTIKLDSRANLKSWQKWLSEKEVEQITKITAGVREKYYSTEKEGEL